MICPELLLPSCCKPTETVLERCTKLTDGGELRCMSLRVSRIVPRPVAPRTLLDCVAPASKGGFDAPPYCRHYRTALQYSLDNDSQLHFAQTFSGLARHVLCRRSPCNGVIRTRQERAA